jgi:DNA repair protein RecO (recombination protein O)
MSRTRVEQEHGFVLHLSPYRETSLIAEAFSRDHGRVALVAKGARRPRSGLRGTLMEFQPLELAWVGGGEMKTLTRAEWQGGQPLLTGRALLFGYYLNELLMRLLPREDAHPALFDAYAATLAELARSADEAALRRFEYDLLRELGVAAPLDVCADGGEAVDPARHYAYLPERGLVEVDPDRVDGPCFSGRALLAMVQDDYRDPQTRQEAKQLMRMLINHTLGGQALNARRVFMELQEL